MRNIDNYTNNYLIEDFEVYQVEYRRKKIIEQIYKYNPQKILEIGCGKEPLFQFVKNKEWVIIEPSKILYQMARNKLTEFSNICIFHGFFEEWVNEHKKEHFDMIICSSLLHEVEKPKQLLKAISEICTKKTIVHINVPNAKSFHRILAKNMNIISDEYEKSNRNFIFQQNTIFDIDKLVKLLLNNNFTILDKGSFFIKPFTHKQMSELLEKKIIDKSVLDGLYNMERDMPLLGSEIFINCKYLNN